MTHLTHIAARRFLNKDDMPGTTHAASQQFEEFKMRPVPESNDFVKKNIDCASSYVEIDEELKKLIYHCRNDRTQLARRRREFLLLEDREKKIKCHEYKESRKSRAEKDLQMRKYWTARKRHAIVWAAYINLMLKIKRFHQVAVLKIKKEKEQRAMLYNASIIAKMFMRMINQRGSRDITEAECDEEIQRIRREKQRESIPDIDE